MAARAAATGSLAKPSRPGIRPHPAPSGIVPGPFRRARPDPSAPAGAAMRPGSAGLPRRATCAAPIEETDFSALIVNKTGRT